MRRLQQPRIILLLLPTFTISKKKPFREKHISIADSIGHGPGMKKPQKTTILLTLFTILTLIFIITVYSTSQSPTEETETNTICMYTSIATYDYTAILDPNTIYNKTTLKPDEGTIYTEITRQINITLAYSFHATLPTETNITYSLNETLKTTALQYQINETTQTTTNQTLIKITPQPIIKSQLEILKRTLETETGTTSTSYILEITPIFTINANTTAGPISQTFTPTLTLTFTSTDQGDIITIADLHQTETGALTEEQTTTRYDILNQRIAAYTLAVISIAGLLFTIYFHIKIQPTTKTPLLEKLLAPHKDLIIETTENPKTTTETPISVTSLKELAKTAEILARPILHAKEGTQHTFYIIDNNTKYQYKINET